MKKQTTDEKTWSETLVEVLEKRGYANAISDVEDAIDRMEVRKLKHIKFRRPFIKGKSELKQEITRLKGEKTHNGN